MTIVKLNSNQSKAVKWVLSAASKDRARSVLMGINSTPNFIVAVDGYRLHAIPQIGLPAENPTNMLNIGKIHNGDNILDPEVGENYYPDITGILPKNKPVLRIAVNPQFLIDALSGFQKGEAVVLNFYHENNPFEVRGQIDDNTPAYALIMPYTMPDNVKNQKDFKPCKNE